MRTVLDASAVVVQCNTVTTGQDETAVAVEDESSEGDSDGAEGAVGDEQDDEEGFPWKVVAAGVAVAAAAAAALMWARRRR